MNTRNYDIDFLRFIAAISVLFFHYTFRGYSADDLSVLNFELISVVSRYGYLGVNLFFLISGYVILMSAHSQTAKGFVISRFARLYPTFWLALGITLAFTFLLSMDGIYPSSRDIVLNLTMIPSVFGADNIDGVYWTLLVELKFYLLVFFLLLFGQIRRVQYYAFFWIIWTLSYFFFAYPYRLHDFLFPSYAAYFISGAMFYLIRVEGRSAFKLVILLCSYIAALMYEGRHLQRQIEHFSSEFSWVIVYSIITLFYLVFLMISMEKKLFFSSRILYYLGALTYPLYLIHQNIGYLIFNSFADTINKYVLLIIVLAGMLILSLVIHLYVEEKISKLLKAKLMRLFHIKPSKENP